MAKAKLSVIRNVGEFDEFLREAAQIDANVAAADAVRRSELLVVEGKYKARTETLLGRRAILAEQLELFYRANRDSLEADGRKSVEFRFGRAGIKLLPAALKLLRGWKWDQVLAVIDPEYVRTSEEVDKQKVKAAKLTAEQLAAFGLKLAGKEDFWFEPKPERGEGVA